MEEPFPVLTSPFRPHYGGAFHCIGPECEDTCCQSWTVPVDKKTYEKYQEFASGRLADITQQYVAVNDIKSPDSLYATIKMTSSGFCPFFSEEKLCNIQSEYGPNYLSATCSIYPRVLNFVEDEMEYSLNLSCPEAARQVLLDPASIDKQTEASESFRKDQFSRLADSRTGITNKPYEFFHEVRILLIKIVRYRQLPLWNRVALIGDLCRDLEAVTARDGEQEISALLTAYHQALKNASFPDKVSNIAADPALQLDVVLRLTNQRIRTAGPSARFQAIFESFLQGLGYSKDSTAESDLRNYVHAEAVYHRIFFDSHPFVMENYLLNYIFRTLFPFGRAASAHYAPAAITDEFLFMAAQYVWINGLLIGIAGRYQKAFSTTHVVQTVQSFARLVEHDIDQRQRMVEYLKTRSLYEMPQMIALLKH